MSAAAARPQAPVSRLAVPCVPPSHSRRIDLLRKLPPLKWLVTRRWFQFAVILPNLAFFLLFLVAGTFGSPVGNRNIIIVFVWIFWWFLLISVMVPALSRAWCLACPLPFFGEWAQRGKLVGVNATDRKKARGRPGPGVLIGRNRYFGKNLRWPRALSNIWLQNIGFLALCTFSAQLLTRPIVSVIALLSLLVVATALHLVYRRRAFCNYVCPVGGFLSLYAMTAIVEVRSRDADVCSRCKDKGCLAGNEAGWGCPWSMYPSRMDRNNYCGLCMECLKTCSHDNMTINLRPPFSDTRLEGYDEAWKAFIMLSLALAYSAIYLGPWGGLKDWANVAEHGDWLGFGLYALGLWLGALVIMPGAFGLATRLGCRLAKPSSVTFKDAFLAFAYPLVPLGLLAWVAFSLPLMMVNGSYVLMVISDPFGWGWDLFGTAQVHWTPVLPHWTPYLQAPILLLGQFYALKAGYDHARRLFRGRRRALWAFAPVAGLQAVVVAGLLVLYLG